MTPVHVAVFWQDQHLNPHLRTFSTELDTNPVGTALTLLEDLRKQGMRHVCMSVENQDSVGKPGVDTIANGKTPDGEVYDWSKQHRAGATRRR